MWITIRKWRRAYLTLIDWLQTFFQLYTMAFVWWSSECPPLFTCLRSTCTIVERGVGKRRFSWNVSPELWARPCWFAAVRHYSRHSVRRKRPVHGRRDSAGDALMHGVAAAGASGHRFNRKRRHNATDDNKAPLAAAETTKTPEVRRAVYCIACEQKALFFFNSPMTSGILGKGAVFHLNYTAAQTLHSQHSERTN